MRQFSESIVDRLQRLGLPLWSFVPSVAETLIRLPSTSPLMAGPEDPLTRTTWSTWLFVFVAGWSLRLRERRARRSATHP